MHPLSNMNADNSISDWPLRPASIVPANTAPSMTRLDALLSRPLSFPPLPPATDTAIDGDTTTATAAGEEEEEMKEQMSDMNDDTTDRPSRSRRSLPYISSSGLSRLRPDDVCSSESRRDNRRVHFTHTHATTATAAPAVPNASTTHTTTAAATEPIHSDNDAASSVCMSEDESTVSAHSYDHTAVTATVPSSDAVATLDDITAALRPFERRDRSQPPLSATTTTAPTTAAVTVSAHTNRASADRESNRLHATLAAEAETDPLYDPTADERDEAWMTQQQQRQRLHSSISGSSSGSQSQSVRTSAPIHTATTPPVSLGHTGTAAGFKSDAHLSCPACFTSLCYDCQRHVTRTHLFRAIFVTADCIVDRSRQVHPLIRDPQQQSNMKYYIVLCRQCKTHVGVMDEEEVYHFYNTLESQV